jgi:hypothetical protein
MLEAWHEETMEYVMRKGYIRAYDGRIRHLPMVRSPDESVAKQAQRQAINSPVQSIGSDLGLMTLGRLLPYLQKKGYDKWLKPCGFIHDAIVCLVREDKVAHGAQIVKTHMENNPLEEWFNWKPEIPILADAEIGRTLAETYELSPDQFMGKANRDKTFSDLLHEERDRLWVGYTDTPEEKKAKVLASIEAIETSIAQSSEIHSRPQKKAATIKRPRKAPSHAKKPHTRLDQGTRQKLSASRRRGPRSRKRNQPRKDAVA